MIRGNQITVYILLYVNDILIASKHPDVVAQIKNQLREHYIVKDIGRVTQFLGIQIDQYSHRRKFVLSQQRYNESMLYKFYLQNASNAYTPAVDYNSLNKYSKDPEKVPYVQNVPTADQLPPLSLQYNLL